MAFHTRYWMHHYGWTPELFDPAFMLFTAQVPLEPGQAVTAELDGLGSVEVYSR